MVWVPPELNPNSGTQAGDLFKARIQAFNKQYPAYQVQVRVKAPSGPGGLLESLTTASAAAPLALPSLVALNRTDLETAALKGLIYPLDKTSTLIDNPDWYAYARQLAVVQGSTFGLPFAGDALILVYRPSKTGGVPIDWPTIFRFGQPVGFAAGDPQSIFTTAMYISNGGLVEDPQRRPLLQLDPLSQVLKLYADGVQRGIFPFWLSQYDSNAQVWQAFRDQRLNMLVSWSSQYLANIPADATAQLLPPSGNSQATLATGWVWAVAEPLTERREQTIRLAEFLSASEFQGKWSEAAGYLPTRPSALTAWQNQSNAKCLQPGRPLGTGAPLQRGNCHPWDPLCKRRHSRY